MEEVKAGPTALDGLPNFFHFKNMENPPIRTNRSTKADRDIIAMVLTFILWFLLGKFAVIGNSPEAPAGPLLVKSPNGGDEGMPDKNSFSDKTQAFRSQAFLFCKES